MAKQPKAVLRIGVLCGDRLIEERTFDGAAPITFGQSIKCALSLPFDGVPRDHVLAVRRGERFVLVVPPQMSGRLGEGEQVTMLRGGETLELPRRARARLWAGELTVLVQEVAAAPRAPAPRLPAVIRGRLIDRIDRRLALVIGGSLALHVAIAAWAWATDADPSILGEPTAATAYRQDTIDVTIPDPLEPTAPAPGAATPVAPAQVPAPIVRPTRIAAHPLTPQPPRLGDDEALRMAAILTNETAAPGGPGEMARRQPGAELAKQLDEARHSDRPITIGRTSRTEPARIGTAPLPGVAIDNPELAPQTPKTERARPGRLTLGPAKADDATTLTAEAVVDKINAAYMRGLERCYARGLAGDGGLGGRVTVGFTVDALGHATDPEASGVSPEVDRCITGEMGRWHFGIPRDKQGAPAEATFHLTLALQGG